MKDFLPKIFKDKDRSVTVFHGLCKGCGLCIEKCPVKAISFSKTDRGYFSTPTVEIDINKCISCGICELICPDTAVKLNELPRSLLRGILAESSFFAPSSVQQAGRFSARQNKKSK